MPPPLLSDKRFKIGLLFAVVFLVAIAILIPVIHFTKSNATSNKVGVPADSSDVTSIDLYKKWYDGDGTYYGSEGEGTCQINSGDLPPAARNSKYLGALNTEQFMQSAACGMCFRVLGEGKGKGLNPITGDFIVFVKDLCPECKEGDMDLAVDGDGRWRIRIRAIQCPVGNTFVQYWIQDSNQWYIKLQDILDYPLSVMDRVPCQKVEMQTKDGRWVTLTATRDGHWKGSAQFDQAGGIPVRLTAITGRVLDDIIPKMENRVVMEGKKKVQFPVVSSLPNAA